MPKRVPKQEVDLEQLAKSQMWREGDLTWKLHSTQRAMYDSFKGSTNRTYAIVCSRRLGKSYLMCVLALEEALKEGNRQIRYAAPTAKMVEKIVLPLMREIMEDMPKEIQPAYHKQNGVFTFKNGSEIHIAGCDNGNADRLRGSSTHLFIIDEAGFVDDLRYVIGSILLPQTLTNSGRGIMASTPGLTPDHEFHAYATECQAKNAYSHYTIYDNPLITMETIEEFKAEEGGEESTSWKREYLAQWVAEEARAIIPEFTPAAQSEIIQERERPEHCTKYMALDMGFRDLTVALFGYYDFEDACIVIEDELVFEGEAPSLVVEECMKREAALWQGDRPRIRICDAEPLLLEELNRNSKYGLVAPEKYNKEAFINNVRMEVKHRRISINPRCETLIAHLKNGIWNDKRTDFARSGDYGHFDAIDALIYLCRHLNKSINPFPDAQVKNFDPHKQFWLPRNRRYGSKHRGMRTAFSRKTRK